MRYHLTHSLPSLTPTKNSSYLILLVVGWNCGTNLEYEDDAKPLDQQFCKIEVSTYQNCYFLFEYTCKADEIH